MEKVKSERLKKFANLFLVFFLALLVFILLGIASGTGTPPVDSPIEVRRVFVDIDGDGKTDLLVSGEVIFNRPVNFTEAQIVP